MSSGVPQRSSGSLMYSFSSASRSGVCIFMESMKFSVGIGPGATALTRIFGASSREKVAVRLFTAAFDAPYGPFFALVPELVPSNVLGGAIGVINSSGALGAFLGSWVVGYLNGATGSPSVSYIFMAVALLLSVILMITVPARSEQRPAGDATVSLRRT